MEAGSPPRGSNERENRQDRTADTRGIQYMRLEMGPGTKPAAASQRQQDGHLQTFESTTSGEHTQQVNAHKDESDARGTRHGMLSEGSRIGGSGNNLLNRITRRESAPYGDQEGHQRKGMYVDVAIPQIFLEMTSC